MGKKRINHLNDLNGSEWLYWTDSLYITSYPPDVTHALRKAHGAMKPPEVMAEIISFFTQRGQLVLDPFAGVGGTLLGAAMTRRQAIGFELNPAWVKIYEEIKAGFMVQDGQLVEADNRPRPNRATSGEWLPRQKDPGPAGSGPGTKGSGTSQLATQSGTWPITGEMRQGDCLELLKELGDESVEVVVTDPPYGAQHGATGFAAETNFNMLNAGETADFGNAPDFETYLELMHRFGLEAHRVLKPQKYLIIMVGDRFRAGEYVPLGYLVAEEMRRVGFRFKGLKIWSNKATQRPLKPYAVLSSFVPNITHQNILILKKE